MRYLGIDWGEKRIGLALGNSENKVATPYKVVAHINEIAAVVKEEEIDKLIVGEPISLAGKSQELAPAFVDFIKSLRIVIAPTAVELMDERLSSKAADALLGDNKLNASRDAIAAMISLQSYFDSLDTK